MQSYSRICDYEVSSRNCSILNGNSDTKKTVSLSLMTVLCSQTTPQTAGCTSSLFLTARCRLCVPFFNSPAISLSAFSLQLCWSWFWFGLAQSSTVKAVWPFSQQRCACKSSVSSHFAPLRVALCWRSRSLVAMVRECWHQLWFAG